MLWRGSWSGRIPDGRQRPATPATSAPPWWRRPGAGSKLRGEGAASAGSAGTDMPQGWLRLSPSSRPLTTIAAQSCALPRPLSRERAAHARHPAVQHPDRARGHHRRRPRHRHRRPAGVHDQGAERTAAGLRARLRRRRDGVRVAVGNPEQVDPVVLARLWRQPRLHLRDPRVPGRPAAHRRDRPPGAQPAREPGSR